MKGTHLIADIINAKCSDAIFSSDWMNILKSLVLKNGLQIINTHLHIFKPPDLPGFTGYVLINASHFAIHTYSDEKKIALDLFSCGDVDIRQIFNEICKHFEINDNNIKALHILDRF
ncbi:MAG: S-adenosylmethionine decarboxylase family protein [Promethearchaeota archaeon]